MKNNSGETPTYNYGVPIVKKGIASDKPYELDGVKYIKVRVTDERGVPWELGAKYEDTNTGIIPIVTKGKPLDVSFPNEDTFLKKQSANVVAVISPEPPNTYNKAIPASLIGQIDMSTLAKMGGALNNVCATNVAEALDYEQRRRELYQREELVTIVHPKNPQSPGMVIDSSGTGSVTHFNAQGNTSNLNSTGVNHDVPEVNIGGAGEAKKSALFGGLDAMKTSFMTEGIPHSNILMPTPTVIPHLQRIVMVAGIIRMIIAVGKIAKEGLQEVKKIQDTLKNAEKLEKASGKTQKYHTNKDRVSKLKDLERMKALLPVMQANGQLTAEQAQEIAGNLAYQQGELQQRNSTSIQVDSYFDQVAQNAGKKARNIVSDQFNQGTKAENQLDNMIDARSNDFRPYSPIGNNVPIRGGF